MAKKQSAKETSIMPDKFSKVIGEFRSGLLDEELTQHLHDLTRTVKATGKPGALQLTFKLKKQGEISVEVTDHVKVVMPPARSSGKTYFTDLEGNLTSRHPDQPSLPPELEGNLTSRPKLTIEGTK
jgi:hypothetical protein